MYFTLYTIVFSDCLKQYIGQTCVGKIKLRDTVIINTKRFKQPEHQQLKVENMWEFVQEILLKYPC